MFPFLWKIEPVIKHFKAPKYDQGCVKIFLLLSTLPIMIQISGKTNIGKTLTQLNCFIFLLKIGGEP